MKFKTAVLYDIENLVGGYGELAGLPGLSLKAIHLQICARSEVERIAIQRAYANWGDSRLSVLRGPIVDLGIDPVQMFGFGRGSRRNATDIQLAIDAIEIAYTRPAVEVFVIVTGDGGFSAVAKKLHECGRLVIGCAYRRFANRVFEAICDDFIWIEDAASEGIELSAKVEGDTQRHPAIGRFARQCSTVKVKSRNTLVREAKFVLERLTKDPECHQILSREGMNVSVIQEALSTRIQDFKALDFGFLRIIDLLRFIGPSASLKVIHRPPSEYRVCYKEGSPEGFVEVHPIESLQDLHTEDYYRRLLAVGDPVLRLPDPASLTAVAQQLELNARKVMDVPFGEILEVIEEAFGGRARDQGSAADLHLRRGVCSGSGRRSFACQRR